MGKIILESTPGLGTTVNVFFPRIDSLGEIPESWNGLEMNKKGGVILVDSEVGNAFVGKAMLEQIGFEVTLFKNTNDSLLCFEQNFEHFDLLMVDTSIDDSVNNRQA